MIDIIKDFIGRINLLDIFFLTVLIYNVIQCFVKGFSLSLISFMKWICHSDCNYFSFKIATCSSEYIQSEFINNAGLGMAILFFSFCNILIEKLSASWW